MPDLQPNFREGDPFGARMINELIRWLQRCITTVKGEGGINTRVSGSTLSISLAQTPIRFAKGKTNGSITARASDSAHGTGSVTIWAKDLTAGDYATTGEDVDVDYISSTTGGLSSGVWVNVVQFADGHWELISVDCGNP